MLEIVVSICCMTYNHEAYIRDALNGFVRQKTNFPFEIIVHDDASTDKTAEIIREYEKRFPEVIKPIYQKDNQYSKRKKIFNDIVLPKASGKYIALCEGDDYWADEYKLQKQVDYMESHPDCTICFSNAYEEDQLDKCERKLFLPHSKEDAKFFPDCDKDYNLSNAYEISFAPTASYVFPREIYDTLISHYTPCATEDLQMRLLLTSQGYAHYINEPLTVYRINVPNSATAKWKTDDKAVIKARELNIVEMLDNINQFTNHTYNSGLWQFKKYHLLNIISCSKVGILKQAEYQKAFDEVSIIKKLKLILKMYLPEKLILLIQRLRGR